jgi:Domain of unknown function (DUF1707)/Domain of unknown function (DUF4190)
MTVGPGYGGREPAYGGPGRSGYGSYGYQGYQAAAAYGRARLRAADADRDRAVEYLKAAFTEGRLTKDEYDARVHRVLTAQTYADLDAVIADLNVPGPFAAPPMPQRTNSLAVASLACGLGQLMLGPLPTIPAIVLGHMARHQIRRTGEGGAGLALAGLLLGYAAVLLGVLVVLFAMVAFMSVAHGGPPAGG